MYTPFKIFFFYQNQLSEKTSFDISILTWLHPCILVWWFTESSNAFDLRQTTLPKLQMQNWPMWIFNELWRWFSIVSAEIYLSKTKSFWKVIWDFAQTGDDKQIYGGSSIPRCISCNDGLIILAYIFLWKSQRILINVKYHKDWKLNESFFYICWQCFWGISLY